ncbi:hypothetical protein SKAU_G00427760 [Synaphobranchus kaupii]|uniref:Uncharacterized protein n=1 Tax=Synaphobranchus kaupii TaxID=118154 RepID=A0A9Q1E4Q8_SYNKA|nr:hypothetical protein SKAU_G00427760 [Synaphobranchus kaupii]
MARPAHSSSPGHRHNREVIDDVALQTQVITTGQMNDPRFHPSISHTFTRSSSSQRAVIGGHSDRSPKARPSSPGNRRNAPPRAVVFIRSEVTAMP